MKRILMFTALLALCFSAAKAQNAISLEQVAGTVGGDIQIGTTVNFQLRIQVANNIDTKLSGTTNGFRIYSPDGAVWTSTTGEYLAAWPPQAGGYDFLRQIAAFGANGVGSDTIAFNNATLFGSGCPPGYNQVAWQINATIPNNPALHNKTLCIDSCSLVGPAQLNWLWNDLSTEILPTWSGGQCFTIVDPNASGGSLLISGDTLAFAAEENGANPTGQAFTVAEAGGGNIAFAVAETSPWMSAVAQGATTPADVDVTVNIAGLAPGLYLDSIEVSSGDADNSPLFKYISLEITEAPKVLVISPDTLRFTAQEGDPNPAGQMFAVSEASGASIAFSVTPNAPWLNAVAQAATTPTNVDVTTSIAGLAPNTYFDSILVTSGAASNSPLYKFVSLEITARPKVLAVDPTSLTFSGLVGDGVLPGQTFEVSETGGANIGYTAEFADGLSDWATIFDASGTTPGVVTVTANIGALGPGTYHDTITVTSPDATNSVSVLLTLNVTAAPEFVLTPDTLFFSGTEGGANPDNQSVEVALSNAGSIDFSAEALAAYIAVDPTSATTPASISVGVDIASLAVGTYTDSILISEIAVQEKGIEQAADVYVYVVTTIEPVVIISDLVVNPTTLSFTAIEGDTSPQNNVFTAIENGGGTVDFTVSSMFGSAWLTFGTGGTTPDSVLVTVDPTGLTPGIYDDTLMVILSDLSDTERVAVVFNINEFVCTNLMVTDTLLMYTAFEGDAIGSPAFRGVTVYGSIPSIQFTYTMAVEAGIDWITLINVGNLPPDTGTVINGDPSDTVLVSVDPSGLAVGTHTALITVTSSSEGVCPPASRTIAVSLTINEVIVPSDDTVRVVNTPAVPGMSVMVPVELKSSCFLFGAHVDLAYDDVNLIIDSISFDRSVFAGATESNDVWSMADGLIQVESQSVGAGLAPVAGIWFDIFATVRCEATPGVYNFTLHDTVGCSDCVGVAFVRDCSGGSPEVEVPEFQPGGIIVDNVENYVCGYVVDTAGNSIAGATVQLWSLFPVGSPIDETMSSGIGSFAFSEFNTVPFSLYATADGYYPNLVEDLNFGDKGIMIVMTPLPELVATSEWVDYYCNTNTYRSEPLPIGSVVEAWANGLLVGRDVVDVAGSYGFMPVYRDDFSTGSVDGARTGDMLTFTVNGQVAIADGNTIYPADFQQIQVCLTAGEQVTQECELAEGWNLVSWRVQTESTDIMTVLGPYMNNIDVVLGFERGGLTYDPDLPEFSTLWNTDHLSGYWIRVKQGMGFTLSVSGTAVATSTPIPVTTGWNLVSYLPEMTMAPEDALVSLDGILLYAYGWDNGILTYQPGSQFSNLDEMMGCNGYWVKVSANGELVYPSPVPVAMAANIIPTRTAAATSSTGYVNGDVNATTQWMNLYSRDLTLDGKSVKAGSVISAHREDGAQIGSFVMNTNGRFGFMPVYGATAGEAAGIKAGQQFYLTVDGKVTNERFTWSSNGDRLEIGNLSAASNTGENPLPNDFALEQNYPNPFNPTTTISFTLPASGKVKLEVYNILGKLVATPYDGIAGAGTTSVVWDGRDGRGESVSSGVYFYRLTTDTFTDTKKMMLLK